MSPQGSKHSNEERTVLCPVDDCDEELLARGAHLHVMRSVGDGHGKQGDIPDHLDFDNLETVGTQEVEMDYPEERDQESDVVRLCPYCEQPFKGAHGVMIHLGQTAGRKNHPEDASDKHELDDFPIVKLDEDENIVEYVDRGKSLNDVGTSRSEATDGDGELEEDNIREYIETLRSEGKDEEADKAEKMLL